ncbi:MAG TPA: adenine phosphoribosyltransferase [bacterium]|jgi:adenine phosphoribosyltransferase|nr:adenine phosphoribosyltransferase [bacterium]HOC88125.1 adenine phosphoribosyltransferase [bacterium]HOZ20325.1 adenine phosphoribosyltransferase [bacterium]
MDLADKIRSIPDFPKPGIVFKDITTLIGDGPALRETIAQLRRRFEGERIDAVIGIESRGFIFAGILAHEFGVGMVPVRKPGKLPSATIRESYALEYGSDSLEMHTDALQPGQRVLIVDDLLATGGTVEAAIRLARALGAEVIGCAFVIELDFLGARQRLTPMRLESLVHVESE